MCGITGVFNFKKGKIDRTLLRRMTDVLKHRGPDDHGYYIDNNIALGHRRLSIIDLSKKGKQPMRNEDGTVYIVYNGEVYNFQELRKKLEKKHRFNSNTDTEIILHAYEEYGEDCVKYFRGMFAFAIWDSKKKKLFLARDRTGQKPLFYYHDKDRFVFASELKSIIQDDSIKREISLDAVSYYLTYGYVPAPLSIFKNIKKLLPGHTLSCTKDGIKTKQYWDLKYAPTNHSESYYCKQIIKLLEEATKLRMISDVPLGAFLSGGIDSSTVVAMMSRVSNNVKTFSIGFEEQSFSELKYARIVAERFKTDHKELIVKPDAIKILPKLIWHYNEPYADSSAVPTYYVSKVTRKYVKVALNGDGGDESFAGYDRYAADRVISYYTIIPSFLRKPINAFARTLPEPTTTKAFLRKVKRVMEVTTFPPEKRYIQFMVQFNDKLKKEIIANKKLDIETDHILTNYFKRCNSKDPTNKKLYVDVKRYLSDDLLVKMDIASMTNSLETRSPFLDHHLMEFAATIPHDLKLKRLNKKYILKKSLLHILPKQILRRGKMGFGVPIGAWFKKDLKDITHDVLLSREARQRRYFDYNRIKKMLDEHNNNRRNHSTRIWNLLWLELWHRIYVDGNVKKPVLDINKLI